MRRVLGAIAAFGLALSTGVLAATSGAGGALAQEDPTFIDRFRNWILYTSRYGDDKICFISSEPEKEEGDYTRRGEPVVMVSVWPDDARVDEVLVQSGYPYDERKGLSVNVDGREFPFGTISGEHAWTSSADVDPELIDAMKRGTTMEVRGNSRRNTYSLDTYSLLGFTAAYNAMRRECGG